MEEILLEILQAITRYSANAPELPVNDPPLFTGWSQLVAAALADDIRAV